MIIDIVSWDPFEGVPVQVGSNVSILTVGAFVLSDADKEDRTWLISKTSTLHNGIEANDTSD
jgi:hypothetical protein